MNDMRLGQPEDIATPEENPRRAERVERLARIKIELVTKIAHLWANKEKSPVLRADFILRVCPEGMPRVHADEMMSFSSVDNFFESDLA